jgi:hypothetical protein
MRRVCGKPNCACRKGRKHISLYLSRSVAGRTSMVYIPRKKEKAAREASARYHTIVSLLSELSEIHLKKLLKRKNG